MELKWLEDFLVLATTRSFSRAAKERHTTQSTLSRRIQQLEDWLGVQLINRSSYPVNLTRAGNHFYRQAVEIVRTTYRARVGARRIGLHATDPLRISAQHVLARHFLPGLMAEIEQHIDLGPCILKSDNLNNCLRDLINDEVDFIVCFHQQTMPDLLDVRNYGWLTLNLDQLIPVSIPDENGDALFKLPGTAEEPVRCIGFSSENPIGWQRQARMTRSDVELHINPVYESTMGDMIRDMVLEGRGMAWLQAMLVDGDLQSGRLVLAGGPSWNQQIEIRLMRTRDTSREVVEHAWHLLANKYSS